SATAVYSPVGPAPTTTERMKTPASPGEGSAHGIGRNRCTASASGERTRQPPHVRQIGPDIPRSTRTEQIACHPDTPALRRLRSRSATHASPHPDTAARGHGLDDDDIQVHRNVAESPAVSRFGRARKTGP